MNRQMTCVAVEGRATSTRLAVRAVSLLRAEQEPAP